MSVDLSSVTDVSRYQDGTFWEGEKDPEPQTLFGRTLELKKLNSAYNNLRANGSFERVFLRGESGSGKTSLALALQQEILQDGGFFCSGKNFQDCGMGQDPHSSIMAGFSDLCDLILQSDIFNEKLRKKVQEILGPDADLLVRTVTSISPFLDDAKFTSRQVKNEAALAKFKAVCKNFLRAMSSLERPVVLFLDDIQWMAQGTCELVKFLLQDDELANLMIILAYRDEEAEYVERTLLDQIDCNVLEIFLTPLDLTSIGEMISAELQSQPEHIREFDALASLLHTRTNGNAFHARQLIASLKNGHYLKKTRNIWMFNAEGIESEKIIEDSLAKLLSNQIQRMDNDNREILKVASIIGYSFSELTLRDAAKDFFPGIKIHKETLESVEALQRVLDKLANEKFIEKTHFGYQFTHDKLQKAFQGLITQDQKVKFHKIIGLKLLHQPSEGSRYQAALHLNKTCAMDKTERIEYARINLHAAKYCQFRSAFLESVIFLRKGLSFLEDGDKWGDTFDLAFEMTQLLVNMEYIVGNLEACEAANKVIYSRAKTIEMKYDSLVVELDVLAAANQQEEMLRHGLCVLRQLGEKIPPLVTSFHLLQKVKRVRSMVDRKTDDEVSALPCADDPRLLILFRVLMRVTINAIFRQKFVLGFYAAVRAAELTITTGLSVHSSHAFYAYGVVEKKLGYIERTYRVGLLALKLFTQFPTAEAECHVFPGICMNLLHFKCRIRDLINLHPHVINYGLDSGDMFSVSLGASYVTYIRLLTGENLQSLEKFLYKIYSRMVDLGQTNLTMSIEPFLQFMQNMSDSDRNILETISLNGNIMVEKEFKSRCSTRNNSFHMITFYLVKMLLYFHFGFFERAEKVRNELKAMKSYPIEHSFVSIPFSFYSAMIYYARYGSTKKKRYLRMGRKAKKLIHQEHLYDNPNATPYLRILNIEELSRKTSNAKDLRRACDLAIRTQEEEGMNHLEALANEQASRILVAAGSSSAVKYLERAASVCKLKWGANAKFELLKTRIAAFETSSIESSVPSMKSTLESSIDTQTTPNTRLNLLRQSLDLPQMPSQTEFTVSEGCRDNNG